MDTNTSINNACPERKLMLGRLLYQLRYLLLAALVTSFAATLTNMNVEDTITLLVIIVWVFYFSRILRL